MKRLGKLLKLETENYCCSFRWSHCHIMLSLLATIVGQNECHDVLGRWLTIIRIEVASLNWDILLRMENCNKELLIRPFLTDITHFTILYHLYFILLYLNLSRSIVDKHHEIFSTVYMIFIKKSFSLNPHHIEISRNGLILLTIDCFSSIVTDERVGYLFHSLDRTNNYHGRTFTHNQT